MGNTKGIYMAPVNTAFLFTTPVEGEALPPPVLEHLQTL